VIAETAGLGNPAMAGGRSLHERRERPHRRHRRGVDQTALVVIKPHHANCGISVRIACEEAEHPHRLLGAGELCENSAVSVIDE
jgi:hypothetical protein